jgi:hypothetical protein
MKMFLLLCSVCMFQWAGAQDTVRVVNSLFSNFEKVRNATGKTYTEASLELEKIRNLRVRYVCLMNGRDTVAAAICFDIRGNDLRIHLSPYRIIGYLDMDETDSLTHALKKFLVFADEPLADGMERFTHFVSRGGVYAGCMQNGGRWRTGISTDPANADALTRLNRSQLKRLIAALEAAAK